MGHRFEAEPLSFSWIGKKGNLGIVRNYRVIRSFVTRCKIIGKRGKGVMVYKSVEGFNGKSAPRWSETRL